MSHSHHPYRRVFRLLPAAFAVLLLVAPVYPAGKAFDGGWLMNVTIPDGPGSRNLATYSFTLSASPRGESYHGRMTITDSSGQVVAGAWRQLGKRISFTYELDCTGAGPCASLVLMGKLKDANTRLRGDVIVMWDSVNEENPARFDTSNGTFTAVRLP